MSLDDVLEQEGISDSVDDIVAWAKERARELTEGVDADPELGPLLSGDGESVPVDVPSLADYGIADSGSRPLSIADRDELPPIPSAANEGPAADGAEEIDDIEELDVEELELVELEEDDAAPATEAGAPAAPAYDVGSDGVARDYYTGEPVDSPAAPGGDAAAREASDEEDAPADEGSPDSDEEDTSAEEEESTDEESTDDDAGESTDDGAADSEVESEEDSADESADEEAEAESPPPPPEPTPEDQTRFGPPDGNEEVPDWKAALLSAQVGDEEAVKKITEESSVTKLPQPVEEEAPKSGRLVAEEEEISRHDIDLSDLDDLDID